MSGDDRHDQLIDTLLSEIIGGQTPPDVSPAVMAALKRRRRRRRFLQAAASAAAVILIVNLASFFQSRYPSIRTWGDYSIAEGGQARRGSTLSTGTEAAGIELGGYCRIEIAPHSALRIEGDEYDERIFLLKGEAACEVNRDTGAFSVHTDAGIVSVLGTRFVVRVVDEIGEDEMVGKQMFVKVLIGSVLLSGVWGSTEIAAGEERTVPENGSAAGIFSEYGKDVVVVKLDGQEKHTSFFYGDDLNAAVKALLGGNRVKLQWRAEGERRRLVSIEMIVPEDKSGEVVGVIVAKAKHWIDVKPEGGPIERYMPRWIGGLPKDGGGLDKHMLEAIARRRVGDKVKVKWEYEERKLVVELTLIQAAPDKEEKPR